MSHVNDVIVEEKKIVLRPASHVCSNKNLFQFLNSMIHLSKGDPPDPDWVLAWNRRVALRSMNSSGREDPIASTLDKRNDSFNVTDSVNRILH